MKAVEKNIERVIFFSRWLQMPVYLGLVVASVLYGAKFMVQLWHLIKDFSALNETHSCCPFWDLLIFRW